MPHLAEQGAGAASFVLLATACLYACPAPLPAARCDDGADCPKGSRCDEELGACVTSQRRCGTAGIFADSFDTGVPSTPWAFCPTSENAPILHQDGAMAIAFDPDGMGSGGGSCTSYLAAALLDDRIWVEVPRATEPTSVADAFFELDLDGDQIAIFQNRADLHFSIWSGYDSQGGSIPYDAEAHRWWGLREAGGSVSFETSRDGQSWETHTVLPTPAHAARARLRIGAWSMNLGEGPGTVVFDNLNAGHAPVDFCATSSFQDPLTGPELHTEWSVEEEDGCQAVFTAGGLELSTPMATSFMCFLSTISGYSLEGSAVTVEIPDGGLPGIDIGIRVWSPLGPALGFGFYGAEVSSWITEESGGGTTYGFDGLSADLRWLRVSEADDVITFEGRVDAADEWSALGSSQVAVDFDHVLVRLELSDDPYLSDPPAQPARAVFRNYNLP